MRPGPSAISVEIRRLRQQRGLSQEDVARLLDIAVKTYRVYETTGEPSLARLRQIAAVLSADLVVELRPR
jgi:transcriptional regulator with XRE-family HTH domain